MYIGLRINVATDNQSHFAFKFFIALFGPGTQLGMRDKVFVTGTKDQTLCIKI